MAKQNRNYRLVVQGARIKSNGRVQTFTISSPFTLEFDITRNAFASANTATFKIMNLSKTTREAIRKDWDAFLTYRTIELQAGYGGNMATIFKGNVSLAQSSRQHDTIVTTIEAFDAGFALANARVDKSFSAGTPYRKILSETIRTMPGVTLGAVGTPSGTTGSTLRGNAFSDNSASLLNTLVPGCFFIDNGVAHVLSEKEVLRGAITKIQSSEGLLNTPIRQQNKVLVDIIFEPKIRVGQLIELESVVESNVNGKYKVLGVRHHGIISESVAGEAITSLELMNNSPFSFVREAGR